MKQLPNLSKDLRKPEQEKRQERGKAKSRVEVRRRNNLHKKHGNENIIRPLKIIFPFVKIEHNILKKFC